MTTGTDAPDVIDPADWERLVMMIAIRYGARSGPDIQDTEQYADGMLGVATAIRLHDPARGKFSSFVGRVIRSRILIGIRDRTGQAGEPRPSIVSFSDVEDGDSPPSDFAAGLIAEPEPVGPDERDTIAALLGCLDERARRLVERVVMKDWTLEEAGRAEPPRLVRGRMLRITQEGVRQVVGRAIQKMRREAERRGRTE